MYTQFIGILALIMGGLSGFIYWIKELSTLLDYGDTFMFVVTFLFGELLIPIYGIIPFIKWFFILFFIGLPFYGIYKLFEKKS